MKCNGDSWVIARRQVSILQLRRTLMSPPIVTRQTRPESGGVAFAAVVVLASSGAGPVFCLPCPLLAQTAWVCTQPGLRLGPQRQGACRETVPCPRRPRNRAVPADRPMQRRGSPPCVCPGGPGAGAPTWPGSAARRLQRWRGGPRQGPGSRAKAPRCSSACLGRRERRSAPSARLCPGAARAACGASAP
jgi:hypothetical protein